MIELNFAISTNQGNVSVKGFAADRESMIGIYHNADAPPGSPYWTVTFMPTGTKIDSLFPALMRTRGCREILLDFAAKIEAAELPAWLVLSSLPWGCDKLPDDFAPIVARIKAAAQA